MTERASRCRSSYKGGPLTVPGELAPPIGYCCGFIIAFALKRWGLSQRSIPYRFGLAMRVSVLISNADG